MPPSPRGGRLRAKPEGGGCGHGAEGDRLESMDLAKRCERVAFWTRGGEQSCEQAQSAQRT